MQLFVYVYIHNWIKGRNRKRTCSFDRTDVNAEASKKCHSKRTRVELSRVTTSVGLTNNTFNVENCEMY